MAAQFEQGIYSEKSKKNKCHLPGLAKLKWPK